MQNTKTPSIWDDNSPDSLVTICTHFCIRHLETFCTFDQFLNCYVLRDTITLPNEICERMIAACSEIDRSIDDDFLLIFKNTKTTPLRRINLSNSAISDKGLAVVLHHNLVELDISGCSNLTQDALELINHLGSDLLSINFGTSSHIFPESGVGCEEGFTSVLSLEMAEPNIIHYNSVKRNVLRIPNLRKLYLKDLFIPLENEYFSSIIKPLVHLTVLDLSRCYYVGTLEYLVHMKQIVSLTLYDVRRLQETISSICQLKLLKHLDISQHDDKYGVYRNPNQVLSEIIESLPSLVSLDISGTNLAGTGIAEHDQNKKTSPDTHQEYVMNDIPGGYVMNDIPGLSSRMFRPLEFLGLYYTSHDACRRHNIPAKKITGDSNEQQILTAAQAYNDRPEVLQRVLNDLFHIVRYETCHNPQLALDVILIAMNRHLSDKHIQISGSASLFYIVKSEEIKKYNFLIKQKLIKAVLNAMWEHKHDATMIRNSCLILCQFKIPQDVLFDYERLVRILLHIVAEDDQEEFVQRIGIYLLNSLACQVDGNQKQLVGQLGAISTMLSLISGRLQRNVCDDVMEIAWSTMWNVTDETPENCRKFLDGKGMEYFLGCLRAFPNKGELLRNMMGLLGNVAEVDYLRPKLMTEEFVGVFSDLLDSPSDGIEVSYNAAGVLSHMASDGYAAWTISTPRREEVLHRMVCAVERWNLNTKRNINYRSFEPILRLLKTDHTPEVQHWAVWALANLSRVYPEKYCPLVQQENGIEMLQALLRKESPYTRIKELALMVITHCERFAKEGIVDDNSDQDGFSQ